MLDDRSYMREPDWRPEAARSGVSICLVVIALNVLFFIIQSRSAAFEQSWSLTAVDIRNFELWKLVTFQFLHGGFFHLLINCLMIWFAGRQIEESLGKVKFITLYLIAGIFGGILHCGLVWVGFLPELYLKNILTGTIEPVSFGQVPEFIENGWVIVKGGVVGASAGVTGLIAAFAILLWNRQLTFLLMFVIPITMKAKFLLMVLITIDLVGLLAGGTNIAHGAHLGGMIWGVLFILLFVQGGTWTGAEPWWDRLKERFSSGRERRVVTIDGGARAYSRDRSGTVEAEESDFVKSEVDPILDKISEQGMHSLTDKERKILEQARKKMGR